MQNLLASLPIGALIVLVLGCNRGSTYPGDHPAPDESAAIGRIAYTRFAREEACRRQSGAVAAPDVDKRMALLRKATESEVQPSACRSNIHQRELDDCVSQIRRWPCELDLKHVTIIHTCKVEPLCGVPREGTL